jgi:hypothetical protein
MLHLVVVLVTTFVLSILPSHADEAFKKPVEQLSSDELNALVDRW